MSFAPRSENNTCKLVFVPRDNEKPMVELAWPIEEENDDDGFITRAEKQIGAKELAYFSFPQEEQNRFSEDSELLRVVKRVTIVVDEDEVQKGTTAENANTRLCAITSLWLPGDACLYMPEEEDDEDGDAISYDLPLTTIEELMRTLQAKRRKIDE